MLNGTYQTVAIKIKIKVLDKRFCRTRFILPNIHHFLRANHHALYALTQFQWLNKSKNSQHEIADKINPIVMLGKPVGKQCVCQPEKSMAVSVLCWSRWSLICISIYIYFTSHLKSSLKIQNNWMAGHCLDMELLYNHNSVFIFI